MSDNVHPKISVILPVYNAGRFLSPAIQSILDQTFADFELIIINDGSTDDSAAVIGSFVDPRIRVITQSNQGLRASLNTGLDQARGQYIARMDQDDISMPERLVQQADFLDVHPDHVLVGATYAYIDEEDRIVGVFPALLDDAEIKRELYTKSPFGHGTVMLRASALRQGGYRYAQEAAHFEDFELWLRFAAAGKYANLPEVLYLWRKNSAGTTTTYGSLQLRKGLELPQQILKKESLRGLSAWPGWKKMHKYRNAAVEVRGQQVDIRRHDAYCSMYVALARLFVRDRSFRRAAVVLGYAFLISPIYTLRVGWDYLSDHARFEL